MYLEGNDNSYRDILKSSSIIGGASILNIFIGMVRTKCVALLIGPAGVGLLGTYTQVTSLVGMVTGLGIGNSGVRQIAEAVGAGDDEQIARTVLTLRRTVWLTGGVGTVLTLLFCLPISRITFNSEAYAAPIAFLAITILLGSIAVGQGCVLQGTRRIGDIARISVAGAIAGTLLSIPCFYLWGQQGIVVSLILCSFASLITSWWFARRVHVMPIMLKWSIMRDEVRQLLTLGISFVSAGFIAALSNYLIRILLIRRFGLHDVGIYQSASSLSGVLVGFVLGAMGTDYYPRLTAACRDNSKVSQMVNEQAEISILLSLPGLAAMLIFAPFVIRVFYTESFLAAVPIVRWTILGVLGRVFSWPLGYVILAKGEGKLFFLTELLSSGGNVLAIIYSTLLWGLTGTGIAFMILYVFYTALMIIVIRNLIGASWNRRTLKLGVLSSSVMLLLMVNCNYVVDPSAQWGINVLILCPVTYFCARRLSRKSGITLRSVFAMARA